MVLRKTVENLRNRPKDERRAAAISVAMLIVAILFVGWVILFWKDLKKNNLQTEAIGNSLEGRLDFSSVAEAKRQIVNLYDDRSSPE